MRGLGLAPSGQHAIKYQLHWFDQPGHGEPDSRRLVSHAESAQCLALKILEGTGEGRSISGWLVREFWCQAILPKLSIEAENRRFQSKLVFQWMFNFTSGLRQGFSKQHQVIQSWVASLDVLSRYASPTSPPCTSLLRGIARTSCSDCWAPVMGGPWQCLR